jgi:ankyrin repeat protein
MLRENPSLANTPDLDGEYPLHHAATSGNVEAARMLIEAGADVHARERSYHTPLSWAMIEGTHPVARLLIQHGATYDLWVAAAFGDLQRVRSFFMPDGKLVPNASVHGSSRKGADGQFLPKPPATDAGVLSDAFFIACINGRSDVARFIMDQAKVTGLPFDLFGLPLHSATRFGHREMVVFLLSLGADRSAVDRHGKTARQIAVAAGHLEIAELL